MLQWLCCVRSFPVLQSQIPANLVLETAHIYYPPVLRPEIRIQFHWAETTASRSVLPLEGLGEHPRPTSQLPGQHPCILGSWPLWASPEPQLSTSTIISPPSPLPPAMRTLLFTLGPIWVIQDNLPSLDL